ncbi:MAG: HAMP domain-containing histidine kinase [Oligoflexales bacterium]|nr:HAMP domain-containing histidine kinase [Oligoflexales bacterium]
METSDQDKFKEKLTKAQGHNETIIEILEHVKQLKSLESGKAALTLEKVEVSEIISQLQDTFVEKIKEKNISFNVVGADIPVFVMADKVSLRSNILNNLVSNAIKFTPPGESITITLENNQKTVDITVADRGIGIPDELIRKIFDPNEKTSRKGTENEEGTGFGLPIVYMFVQYNKGEIVVQSETSGENRGTKFKISLMAA